MQDWTKPWQGGRQCSHNYANSAYTQHYNICASIAIHRFSYHQRDICRRRRHREAGKGRSVAPRWPCRMAILQRSAGRVLLLSLRIWSIHLQRGQPGGRFHSRLGSWPSVRSMWCCSALCAGTSSSSLAIWPKTVLWRRDMLLEIDRRLVNAEIWSFPTNWCHLTWRSCLWHFMWNASRVRESEASTVHVSEAYSRTEVTRAWQTRTFVVVDRFLSFHILCSDEMTEEWDIKLNRLLRYENHRLPLNCQISSSWITFISSNNWRLNLSYFFTSTCS